MTIAGAELGPRRQGHLAGAIGRVSLCPREGGGWHAVVRAVEIAAAEAALGDRR